MPKDAGSRIPIRLAIAVAAFIILLLATTFLYLVFLGTFDPRMLRSTIFSVAVGSGVLAWGIFAKRAKDPRQVLYYPAVFLGLTAVVAMEVGGSLGLASLILVGVSLIVLAAAYALWLLPKTRWESLLPIELVHPLLILASRDLEAGAETPREVRIRLEEDSTGAWKSFADFLESERMFSRVRVRRNSVDLFIARVHPLPVSRAIWPWWFLFGVSRVRVVPSRRITVRINGQVYGLLDNPSPYEEYCQRIATRLLRSFRAFREGDVEAARHPLTVQNAVV